MVKRRNVRIDDKEYVIKCSIATAELFERLTGAKFITVLSDIVKIQKKLEETAELETEELIEYILDMQIKASKLTYCMIIEAKKDGDNKDFEMTYDEWLSSVSSIDQETLKGVLAVAMGLFPRKLQKQERADNQDQTE